MPSKLNYYQFSSVFPVLTLVWKTQNQTINKTTENPSILYKVGEDKWRFNYSVTILKLQLMQLTVYKKKKKIQSKVNPVRK